ncbi:hypothetical protein [Acinetobacter bereziniae]|uniref:Mu-like prophage FluMu N-terminal domain-containing protein n=1 Tax=Acinetobacter bereziniae NIPH 3 TaxID=1217651 RepID=N8YLF3_ACIBZ|nr:hypothetical protein [Acinetobacter bereziniae]ENV20403.1 hypothetical protein F963_03688 [Acinetobacter bereziniae NIPH 3]
MPKYIAKQSIGHFRPGDEIKGLEDKQIQALLVSGAIEEEKAPEKTNQDGSAQQLAELAAQVADLKTNELLLIDAKDKAEAQVADLKAEIVKLQDALNASKPKSAKDKEQPQAQSEKAATESK